MELLLSLIVLLLAVQALVLMTILGRIDRADVRMVIVVREWLPKAKTEPPEIPEAEPMQGWETADDYDYDPNWWKHGKPPPG